MMTMTKVLNENINILTCQLSRMPPLSSQHLLRGRKPIVYIKVSISVDWVRREEEVSRSGETFQNMNFISP